MKFFHCLYLNFGFSVFLDLDLDLGLGLIPLFFSMKNQIVRVGFAAKLIAGKCDRSNGIRH